MTSRARPLNAAERKTAQEAYVAILAAVDGKTRLNQIVKLASDQCRRDYQSGLIGRWHMIEAFVEGHRGNYSMGELHRQDDGRILAAIAGAGLRSESPQFDATELYRLANLIEVQRVEWRARA